MSKLEEIISSTVFDLTHLEVNTIIKDEMSASKAPASPRMILHELSEKFHFKLVDLGKKYYQIIGTSGEKGEELFRGNPVYKGSAYNSFREFSHRAQEASIRLSENENLIKGVFPAEEIHADLKMLMRIKAISDDVRSILMTVDSEKEKPDGVNWLYKFDNPAIVNKFRTLSSAEAKKMELKLDLRQLMLFKKANDIGTERVVLQTIIGIDGDVTTRISQAFADKPLIFVNEVHHEAINISVRFWESLVNIVVKLGHTILNTITNKT